MEFQANSWIRGPLIGSGSFGKVNLAMTKENGEFFAVKSVECSNEGISIPEVEEIENEAQILQGLNSPVIVKCFGSSFSLENGKKMRNMFMEYMSGGSVADLMQKLGGGFEETLVRKYTRSILEGIAYLHARGIVHRDIKGRNVLVGSSGGSVKLADFGAARKIGPGEGTSAVLKLKGTPLWMAPEVVLHKGQGLASDIWSLGCTVVEMATGKAPWGNINFDNPFAALYHIGCSREVPHLPSCLSPHGHDFLSRCFKRDPKLRWTASQLLQHQFITGTVGSTMPTCFGTPRTPILVTRSFSRQHETTDFLMADEATLSKPEESTTPSSDLSVRTGFRQSNHDIASGAKEVCVMVQEEIEQLPKNHQIKRTGKLSCSTERQPNLLGCKAGDEASQLLQQKDITMGDSLTAKRECKRCLDCTRSPEDQKKLGPGVTDSLEDVSEGCCSSPNAADLPSTGKPTYASLRTTFRKLTEAERRFCVNCRQNIFGGCVGQREAMKFRRRNRRSRG